MLGWQIRNGMTRGCCIALVLLLQTMPLTGSLSTTGPHANNSGFASWPNSSSRTPLTCQRSSATPRGIGIAVFFILVIIVAVVGNVIVIAAIVYTSSLHSQVTNHFVISLAVSDILIPLIILPFRTMMALNNGLFCSTDIACKIVLFLSTYFDIASITNILLISIDRFTAVTFPLTYTSIMTERRAKGLIAVVWIYSVIWASLGVFDWEKPHHIATTIKSNRCVNSNRYYYMVVFSVVFIVPLIAIGIMYLAILNEALKHVRAIGALEVQEDQRESKNARKRRMKHFRSMKSISVVYGAFLVCWLPNCIIAIHSNLNKSWWNNFRREYPDLFFTINYLFNQILPPLNCTLNPFIYSLLHRNFRAAFTFTVCRMIGKHRARRMTESSLRYSETQTARKRAMSRNKKEEPQNKTKDAVAEHKF